MASEVALQSFITDFLSISQGNDLSVCTYIHMKHLEPPTNSTIRRDTQGDYEKNILQIFHRALLEPRECSRRDEIVGLLLLFSENCIAETRHGFQHFKFAMNPTKTSRNCQMLSRGRLFRISVDLEEISV
ncbi:hypothetical protein NQ318_018577 [Aromia moschata]|uniref:Uncharacterized protein n=1 Tax=Aromia moschata TaxID=1265417 RepID=A0AAV8ZHY5_9CUCU|nr:hypothetical protein NQ318_018577 [Aromia moschata]